MHKTVRLCVCAVMVCALGAAHQQVPARLVGTLLGRSGNSVAYCEDGAKIVTSDGLFAVVWDAQTLKPISVELAASYRAPQFSADGNLLFCDRADGGYLWDVHASKLAIPVLRHKATAIVGSLSRRGSVAATAGDTARELVIWDLKAARPRFRLEHSSPVMDSLFSFDGTMLVSVEGPAQGERGVYRFDIWNTSTGKRVAPPIAEPGATKPLVALTRDGRRIALPVSAKSVGVYETTSGKCLAANEAFDDSPMDLGLLRQILFLGEGQSFVTLTDSFARVWDSSSGKPLTGKLPVIADVLNVSPDGREFAGDLLAGVWSVQTQKRIEEFGPRECDAVAFSPDGKEIALGYQYPAKHGDSYSEVWGLQHDRR